MTDGHWQLEGSAAELYQRYLVPGITSRRTSSIVPNFAAGRRCWMSLAAPGLWLVWRLKKW